MDINKSLSNLLITLYFLWTRQVEFDDPLQTPIYSVSTITRGQLLCIVAAFYFRHSGTTFAALSDILDLLNLIVLGCIIRSLYHFKKFFFSDKHVVEMHFYCPTCESYLGTKKKRFLCSTCRHPVRKEECVQSKCFFLTSSISDQLKEILE